MEHFPQLHPVLVGPGDFLLIVMFLLSGVIVSFEEDDIDEEDIMLGVRLPGRARTKSPIASNTMDDCIIANNF